MILPVFLFTWMSATTAACEPAKPPSAMPRPVTMLPVCEVRVGDLRLPVRELRDRGQDVLPAVPVSGRSSALVALRRCSGAGTRPGPCFAAYGELVDHLLGGERRLRRARRPQERCVLKYVVRAAAASSPMHPPVRGSLYCAPDVRRVDAAEPERRRLVARELPAVGVGRRRSSLDREVGGVGARRCCRSASTPPRMSYMLAGP